MAMIALGIDPGTARMGYGVVVAGSELRAVEYGVVETRPDRPMPERLVILFDRLGELLEAHRPDVVAVEQLFFARNVTTAIAVGQARGVVLLAAARAGVPVVEYAPTEVKQAVVGFGRADKEQMQEMVRILLGLEHPPDPDDAADALAVALCHLQSAAFAAHVAAGEEG